MRTVVVRVHMHMDRMVCLKTGVRDSKCFGVRVPGLRSLG